MTLALMLTASVLQPVVGFLTDRRPAPHALVVGMGFTLIGLLLLAAAWTYSLLLVAAALVGRRVVGLPPGIVARRPDGLGRAAWPGAVGLSGRRQRRLGARSAARRLPGGALRSAEHRLVRAAWPWPACCSPSASASGSTRTTSKRPRPALPDRRVEPRDAGLPPRRVAAALVILVRLIFSKYFYMASLASYFTFYLMTKFHVSVQSAQLHLFSFLAAVAVGTILGGPIGDRIGRKPVIWGSILGVLPFSLLLPHANLFWTGVLAAVIGLILASAFSAIVVYAQELVPGRVGLISGVFFGFAFGMGGIGAAALGQLADRIGIEGVYALCALLPAIGLLAAFLPDVDRRSAPRRA